MNIKPYSALDTPAQQAPTRANFPALRHFWPCTETTGAVTMTDPVGGVVVATPAMTIITNGVVPNQAAASAPTAGTLTAPGTKNFIFMCVGKYAASAVLYGKIATPGAGGISLHSAQTLSLYDGTNTLSGGVAFTSDSATVYGRAMSVTFGGNMQNFECTVSANTTKSIVALSAATPAGITAMGAIEQSILLGPTTALAQYGIAMFMFSGALPSTAFIQSMLAWHTANWPAGNKTIFPGMKGIT